MLPDPRNPDQIAQSSYTRSPNITPQSQYPQSPSQTTQSPSPLYHDQISQSSYTQSSNQTTQSLHPLSPNQKTRSPGPQNPNPTSKLADPQNPNQIALSPRPQSPNQFSQSPRPQSPRSPVPQSKNLTPPSPEPIDPIMPPEVNLNHSLCSSLSPFVTLETINQSLSQSPPNGYKITQNASVPPRRTAHGLTEFFLAPPTSLHSIASESTAVFAQNPLKVLPANLLSPAPSDPFLLTSVTFTSSASSHPLCPSTSSSLLCSVEPAFSFPTLTSSAASQLPPQTPPPLELTPPPAQLLGSDDEEQEDPSDYCKGEMRLQLHKVKHCIGILLLRLLRSM